MMSIFRKNFNWIFCAISAAGIIFGLSQAPASAKTTAQILEEIPVQHNGRIKPFQSFAEEISLSVLGSREWQKQPAALRVWTWLAHPARSGSEPLLQVPKILQAEFSPKVIRGRISPDLVLQDEKFMRLVQEASERRDAKEKLSELDKKRIALYERAAVFQQTASGAQPGWIAHPEDPRIGWLSFEAFNDPSVRSSLDQIFPKEAVARFEKARLALTEAAAENFSSENSRALAQEYADAVTGMLTSLGIQIDQQHLRTELLYNRTHPFRLASAIYLLAAILFLISQRFSKRLFSAGAILLFSAGFLIHLTGFILRCLISGRAPVTNMYESMIWVSWAAILFAGILYAVYRMPSIPAVASIVGAFVLILAESFPAVLDPAISPLVPVLRSNWWLTIHVLTITLSYGAFALAWGLGHAAMFSYVMKPQESQAAAHLTNFVYRAVQIGVILLAAGTVLGGVWANYSWGRFWGWDPKETWALIALLGYLTVLHCRFMKWLDAFGFAASSVAAFLGVVMAWYGVNFVLAAGLHSYGASNGGAQYVMSAALLDLVLVGLLSKIYSVRKNQSALSGKTI